MGKILSEQRSLHEYFEKKALFKESLQKRPSEAQAEIGS